MAFLFGWRKVPAHLILLVSIFVPVHALIISSPITILTRWSSEASLNQGQPMRHIDTSDQDEQYSRAFPSPVSTTNLNPAPGFGVLEDLHGALETLQSRFFEVWLGTWPDAIDWTAAVIGTHISDGLSSLTKSLEYLLPFDGTSAEENPIARAQAVENEINKYFSQSVAYYFGEDAFAIRTQAYDDMLWVVLGWLESVKFINFHVNKHYPRILHSTTLKQSPWYGHQFQPSFAHRARVFYELASKGWDTTLCGGGMVWNPNLGPYKNAITNELFIAAAIGMYLYFPGDPNDSPFLDGVRTRSIPRKRHDDRFLAAAINAYGWLRNANMTNTQGLYVDGFHIKGWGKNGSIGTGECDVRNEMVYTYNQGVILSGLRGLWEGTGNTSYLTDGHRLVRNVIAATGWSATNGKRTRSWSGLGRDGVLEDYCDSRGDCSQDSQGFKGIFFHHLTLFCEPLPSEATMPGRTYPATPEERFLHAQSCREYVPWVAHNANAALKTRNDDGLFGMWWGYHTVETTSDSSFEIPSLPNYAEDYRNTAKVPLDGFYGEHDSSIRKKEDHDWANANIQDVNDRGRGRTVETQGSGVAVVRALWEFIHMFRHDN